ncbi:MAG TPA: hypothetical protein VGX96_06875 [Candidatus Elarobacter sp.]|jgi:hypothetical protein|nr:hypothetical protein [Candidatus Elarobacter sp.]
MELSLNRGFLLGVAAFVVVYALEGQWSRLQRDFKHYDAMRAMSGDTPFVREQLERAAGLAGWLIASQTPAVAGTTRGLVQSLREDIVRYAKLDTM